MTYVGEIFKLTRHFVRVCVCRRLCSEFMNSFTRHQHLFDITAKRLTSIRNFSHILLPFSCSNCAKK